MKALVTPFPGIPHGKLASDRVHIWCCSDTEGGELTDTKFRLRNPHDHVTIKVERRWDVMTALFDSVNTFDYLLSIY